MNPDKLFDYLDGKLSPADREALEEKLMSDAQLRREFNIAREIYRSGRDSPEVIVPDPAEMERGAKLGRRIATAAVILVFLNVAGGLGVIAWKTKKPEPNKPRTTSIEQQVNESAKVAAQNALPPPSLSDDEIPLSAAKSEWENLSAAVITAAEACGGSAIKDASETSILVVASIPRERVTEFRRKVLGPTAPASASTSSANETATIQIRITAPAR
ncbi:MAG: zf-HC2 domain-containing protein [Verrucomicrobiota bacterium]|nr:zf-HC2 domain-containing protein [Verrucomicrobiota bacterium]